MNTQLAIKESDLELVVSEKTLGSLTTNAIQIRDMVKSTLPILRDLGSSMPTHESHSQLQ